MRRDCLFEVRRYQLEIPVFTTSSFFVVFLKMSAIMDPNEYLWKSEDRKIRKPPRTEIHVVFVVVSHLNRLESLAQSVSPSVWLRRTGSVLNVEIATLQLEITVTIVERRSLLEEEV